MKYVRFCSPDGHVGRGILSGQEIGELEGDIFSQYRLIGRKYGLREAKLLPPCEPGKIVGVGANYKSHLSSKHMDPPSCPRLFIKPGSSVIGPDDRIICPDPAHTIHFEGELAVVMGKRCSKVPEEKALDHVFGYTCINDVTDRTMLEEDGQWTRGKGADTFAPLGPVIADGIDGGNLILETRVQGQVRQHMSTSDLYFPIPYLISFISTYMTLYPGDMIATGSPVGMGPLKVGETVEVEIQGIGILKNKMTVKEVKP